MRAVPWPWAGGTHGQAALHAVQHTEPIEQDGSKRGTGHAGEDRKHCRQRRHAAYVLGDSHGHRAVIDFVASDAVTAPSISSAQATITTDSTPVADPAATPARIRANDPSDVLDQR